MAHQIDRTKGYTGDTSIKLQCVIVTEDNIVKTGAVTIGSYTTVDKDRVLQAVPGGHIDNGVWDCNIDGTWSRSADFNGSRDIVEGTLIPVLRNKDGVEEYRVLRVSSISNIIGDDLITFTGAFLSPQDPDVLTDATLTGVERIALKQSGNWFRATVQSISAFITGIYTVTLHVGVGGVAQTLLAILRGQAVSAKSFGAVGDGTGDYTAELQSFLNFAAATGYGVIPAGTYNVTNLSIPEADFTLVGQNATIRKITGGSSAYLAASERWINNVGFASLPVRISGITFDGAGIAQNSLVMQSYFGELDNIDVIGATGDGLVFPNFTANGTTAIAGGQSNCEIRNSRIHDNDGVGLSIIDPAYTRMKDWKLLNCFIYDNHGGNLYADDCAGAEIADSHFYHVNDLTPLGTVYLGKTFGTLVSNNIFEATANGLPCIDVLGGSNPPQFSCNHFWSEVLLRFAADCYVMNFVGNHFYNTAHYKHNYDSVDRVVISTGNTFDGASATNIYQFGSGTYTGRYITANDYCKAEDISYTGTQRSGGKKTSPQFEYVEFPTSASYSVTLRNGATQVFTAALTAQVDVTMPTGLQGRRFRFVRAPSATGAFSVVIASGAATLAAAGQWADLDFDGTQWRKTAGGSL